MITGLKSMQAIRDDPETAHAKIFLTPMIIICMHITHNISITCCSTNNYSFTFIRFWDKQNIDDRSANNHSVIRFEKAQSKT